MRGFPRDVKEDNGVRHFAFLSAAVNQSPESGFIFEQKQTPVRTCQENSRNSNQDRHRFSRSIMEMKTVIRGGIVPVGRGNTGQLWAKSTEA